MTTKAKPCRVCAHLERAVVERGLGVGRSPRSIQRRYSDLSRKAIEHHSDVCLNREERAA